MLIKVTNIFIYFINFHTKRPKENKTPKVFKKILMCCGGTGITPIYQLLMAICDNSNDTTEVFLLYANRTEDDILLRK